MRQRESDGIPDNVTQMRGRCLCVSGGVWDRNKGMLRLCNSNSGLSGSD